MRDGSAHRSTKEQGGQVCSRFRASVACFLLFLTGKRKGPDARFLRSTKIRNRPLEELDRAKLDEDLLKDW